MEHRPFAGSTLRFVALTQIAFCVLLLLAFASWQIEPPRDASGAALNASTPASANLRAASGSATPVIGSAKQILAPQLVPGQPQLDQFTVALYHFDAPGPVAIDETGTYPGTYHGNAGVTSDGLYSGALRLDGASSYVSIDNLPALPQGTLEMFVDFKEQCAGMGWTYIATANDGIGGGDFFRIGMVDVTILSGGVWQKAQSGINPCRYMTDASIAGRWPYETWRMHHVAATWGPRGEEIWVDGVLHGVGVVDNDNQPAWTYWCNPQMQLGLSPWPPNSLAPVCATPVMAPNMPAYPPGDYVGGIPASQFLIGWGKSSSYYHGRIDEVRISNVQRTFTTSVVPTITPTPSITPNFIGAEYADDASTLALYHLNSTGSNPRTAYNEHTYQWDGSLQGSSDISNPGRFGSALVLSSGSNPTQFVMPNSPGLYDGSIEAWVYADPSSPPGILFEAENAWNSDIMVFGTRPSRQNLFFQIQSDRGWYEADSNIYPSDLADGWHHVVGTWGYRGLEIWLDGELCVTRPYSGLAYVGVKDYRIGCDMWGNCWRGKVDEVRLSNVQRRFTGSAYAAVRSSARISQDLSPFRLFLPLIDVIPTPIPPPRVPCKPLEK